MLRSIPKFLLVCTAFAPVMLTQAAVWIYDANPEMQGPSALLVFLALALVWLCDIVIRRSAKELASNPVKVTAIKPADKEIIGFVLAYLLPLARGSGFEGFPVIVVLIVFFMVIMTSNAYHTNPLLGFLGYHFYEVTIANVGYVLISKRDLHNVQVIKQVAQITNYMLLDTTTERNESDPVDQEG